MGVDNETKINSLNIVFNNDKEYLKMLKKRAEKDGQNDEGENNLCITEDDHSLDTVEYYYDDRTNEIMISTEAVSNKGNVYIYLTIPLSDIVLIDILQHSVKKFNKLKAVLENLSN